MCCTHSPGATQYLSQAQARSGWVQAQDHTRDGRGGWVGSTGEVGDSQRKGRQAAPGKMSKVLPGGETRGS